MSDRRSPEPTWRRSGRKLGATLAVDRVDLAIHRGEVVMIMGRPGCVKSTLLRCRNHLAVPKEGLVVFEDQPMGLRQDRAGRLQGSAADILDRTAAPLAEAAA